MSRLKEFYEDKQLQEEWAAFIMNVLNTEALKRVYQGKDTAALKEARDIIGKSFRELNALFTPKRPRRRSSRAV